METTCAAGGPRAGTGEPALRRFGLENTALANKVLGGIIAEFKSGKIAKTISNTPFIRDPNDDRPCWNWSLKNRILMVMQGTFDARNIVQWNAVGRSIVPNRSAIYIVRPRIRYGCAKCSPKQKRTVWMSYQKDSRKYVCAKCEFSCEYTKIGETSDAETIKRIRGYGCQPEFRIEDTVGKTLPQYRPKQMPPLSDVAAEWNIAIKYQTDPTCRTMGSYRLEHNDIHLGTENAGIFFHEISHAADNIILQKKGKRLRGGQDAIQEAVAQLSACVLSELYATDSNKEFTFEYLRQYSRHGRNDEVARLALRVLDRTGAVIDLILSTAQKLEKKRPM